MSAFHQNETDRLRHRKRVNHPLSSAPYAMFRAQHGGAACILRNSSRAIGRQIHPIAFTSTG